MTSESPALVTTTCAGCGQTDDHPVASFHVGVATVFGEKTFHPKDLDQDGYLDYHFDCVPEQLLHLVDPAHVEAATSGTHGDALRTLITTEA
jgi:hypothetical protein